MEAEPFPTRNTATRPDPSSPGGPYHAPRARGRATPSEQRRLEDTTHLKLEAPAQVRLGLQRRAPANLRRHANRAAVRFFGLVAADLVAFGIMRELLRAVRDGALFGHQTAEVLRWLLPGGYLNGWQFASALFLGLIVLGNYGPGDRRRDPGRLFLACALAAALPLWAMVWEHGLEVVFVQYSLTVMLVWAGVLAERLTIDRILTRFRDPQRDAAETLFVGRADDCNTTASSLAFGTGSEYRPIGFVDVESPSSSGALGRISDLPILLAASGAEVVVLCGSLTDYQFHDVVDTALAGGCQVLSVPRAVDLVGVNPTTVWRGGQVLVELTRPALKGRQLLLKRLLDLAGSMLGLLVLSPVFALIWLAIRLESSGPALFGHRRLGINGEVFRCLKFRSMRGDAESRLRTDPTLLGEYLRNNYKLPESRDPRLTRVGRFLRTTSLDELPQLINVFHGNMSLVGPRPIVPEELEKYGHAAAVFLSLKPGMTGAWAVNGRSHVAYPDRADIELEYARNWSLGRDLWILVKTLPAVVMRRGAH